MPKLKLTDADFENLGEGSQRFLIQPGFYPAKLKSREIADGPHGEKLVFWWDVFIDPSRKQSVTLYRQYNVYRDAGNRFIFGDGHAYKADWIRANDGKHPIERKRMPVKVFGDRLLWVKVRTVTKDKDKMPTHPSLHYSIVAMVFAPFNEAETFQTYPVQLSDFIDENP